MSYDIEIIDITMSDVEVVVYEANMTSNLAPMWKAAGFDFSDWDNGEAGEMVYDLRMAVRELSRNPDHYKKYNPENGWGDYEGCLDFLRELLENATTHHKGILHVST